VAAGQTVAVARPGAVMPDGTKLKVAKLRGQESNGMILAEDEVAISTEHATTMVLEDGLLPGTPLIDVLPIATDVLVLEITPNRPDCLGIYGVAREVHAATGAPLALPPWIDDPAAIEGRLDAVRITVDCPALCPRFTARAFEDVKIGPSPPWLKARLMAAGQRPISNVVDITNYVMLLTGQPLHAFDLDRIGGAQLTVRRAHDGETVQTLDDQTRTLDPDMVLIADGDGPTSIAGVMGGARSEVEQTTTRVLMEAANWDGANIHRTSLKLGLRSEASTRFEKQLAPEQAMEAQAVAAVLMEVCGARVLPGTIDVGGAGPRARIIRLRDARVSGLLGVDVARARSAEILSALEFEVADAPDGLDVAVPSFRREDVTREADLIEEVARLDGVQKLPSTLPSRHNASGRLTPRQVMRRRASDTLAAQGLHEIVGWSFVGPDLADRLRLSRRDAVELENPMSIEQSQLRTTLLGSLLDVARHNRSRGSAVVRLFEAGAVYLPGEPGRLPTERYHVAGLMIGAVRPQTWRDPRPRPADFFAAKGAVQGLFETLRVEWSLQPAREPFLHPGRAARLLAGEETVGWVGEIHPLVAERWDLAESVAAFEVDLDAVAQPPTAMYEDVTSFPEVREDLAVVVSETISAAELVAVVRRAGAPLLASVEVFDVYRDPQRIGEGNVSLALRLAYRAPDRTLTDEEVARRRDTISRALEQELGGRIRAS
jgi:phenylalanyl-tRNA synthetase beta chain